ncbi:hypothetical protein [uncultured virus]|jgi:hypothetical protein|uniref:Uncharacterized protein n=1 Tax=uncultured virus TaxID=340016 RepID=A0A218MM44_9VIRU|nr:hypothetical protein [uncultured virus]
MRTLKNLGHGGLHQGDPLAVYGSRGRKEISTVDELLPFLQGRTTDPSGRPIGLPYDPVTTRKQGEYEMHIQEATGEEVKKIEELERLIDQTGYDEDRTTVVSDGQGGYVKRHMSDIYNELNDLIDQISTRAVSKKEEQERQSRLSKGNPKPGPGEFRYGGKVPMTFMKPKYR